MDNINLKCLLKICILILCNNVLLCVCFTSYVFGDSLVDAGNNNYIFTLSKADSPPYGIDFKPSGGRPTGRFTNGRTISDIVGEAFGEESFPPPYLAPNTETDAFLRGINYASGASGILDQTGFLFIGRVPLREQVNNFEESKKRMVKAIGENRTEEMLSKAIFSFTIGSNDVLNYVQPSIPFLDTHDNISPSMFQHFMVSNLTIQLKRLHKLGARKFIVVGVGPLGCIPFVRAINLLPTGSCSMKVDEIIQGYNSKLNLMLNRLNQELGPQSIFIYANSYDVVLKIITNHCQYGFEDAFSPCCGGTIPPFVCFDYDGKNTSSNYCEDRSKFVFWDAYHPTEAANQIIAKMLLDGDQSISSPINIRQLYNYM